MTFFTIVTF